MKFFRYLIAPALLAATAIGVPQEATPEQRGKWPVDNNHDILHFEANIGSFRNIDGAGRLEVNFQGTILVSGLAEGGTTTVTGNIRKEDTWKGKTLYTGQGKLVVDGSWRVIQWFGTKMSGHWYGKGIMRVMGEFDQNLQTGRHWGIDATNKVNWFATSVMLVELPSRQVRQGTVKAIRKPMSEW